MGKSLYDSNNDKKNSILSDLVSIILGFNNFPLNMYKNTLKHSHKYQNITNSMQIYNTINILINKNNS